MIFSKDFNHSYWELKQYFKKQDLIVVGSGIVGLSTAISFSEDHPHAKVLVLERGILPNGASTKNAGFACFGSAGELIDDLKNMPEKKVWETVHMRWKGLQLLRNRLKDKNIRYQGLGGYELFRDQKKYETCRESLSMLNKEFKKLTGLKNCYSELTPAHLPFASLRGCIFNRYEGQLDTSLLMHQLQVLAIKKGISILNSIHVKSFTEHNTGIELESNFGTFHSHKLVIATNAFATQLLKIDHVVPARAQVLITKPIPHLNIEGSFHFDEGYYYFRNIDNRILFGGGRNLDLKTETSFEPSLNPKIQSKLDKLLKEFILPGIPHTVEKRWTGIMGIGNEKKPIVQFYGKHTLIAVRMGGMGVAIGSWVGKEASKLLR